MKQPQTIEECIKYLRTLGDVKKGYEHFAKDKDACRPCTLCEVDPYKVADLLEKEFNNQS